MAIYLTKRKGELRQANPNYTGIAYKLGDKFYDKNFDTTNHVATVMVVLGEIRQVTYGDYFRYKNDKIDVYQTV
jgi:hypothetical protein